MQADDDLRLGHEIDTPDSWVSAGRPSTSLESILASGETFPVSCPFKYSGMPADARAFPDGVLATLRSTSRDNRFVLAAVSVSQSVGSRFDSQAAHQLASGRSEHLPAPSLALRLRAVQHAARGFAFGEVFHDRSVALGHCDGGVARLVVDRASDLGSARASLKDLVWAK
jgi:hypothetical protein